MFERFIIVPGSLRNAVRNDVGGFEFQVRIAYYRGLGLSMVEDIEVAIDGSRIDSATILFKVADGEFSLSEMEQNQTARWELNETATIFVPHQGGLAPGLHELSVLEVLRISYMPALARRGDAKMLTIA
jgi:Domain of unknown function (DUF6379)